MRTPATALVLSLALAGACAAPGLLPRAPEIRTGPELEVRGRLTGKEDLPAPSPWADARRRSERRVEVVCDLLAFDTDAADAILGERRSTTIGTADRAETERFLGSLQAVPGVLPLTAPRLELFDGVPGDLSVSEERAYVADFELKAGADTWVVDPVVDTAKSGVLVQTRGTLRDDSHVVDLELRVVLCDLTKPLPEVEAEVFGTTEVRLQIPLVRRIELSTAAALDPEQALWITCPRWDGAGGRLLLLVSAREAPSADGETRAGDYAPR